MHTHSFSDAAPLPRHMFWSFVNAHKFDEIANYPGAVRQYIFNHAMCGGKRNKEPGTAQTPLVFSIYQQGRHGPQNGYRFCVVHKGYYVGSSEKREGEPEDDIDKLEKNIPQGHEEMVVLGEPAVADPEAEPEKGE